MPLSELARKLGMNYKTAVYGFNELLKAGYIKRFTTLTAPHKDLSIIAVFVKYMVMKEDERLDAYAKRLFTHDDENPLVSRYLLKTSLIGSYDSFFMGTFDSVRKALKYGIGSYQKTLGSIAYNKMAYGAVDDVLLGRLPIRSMDLKKEYIESRSKGMLTL